MISSSHISKQYGRQLFFADASFQLNPSEKVRGAVQVSSPSAARNWVLPLFYFDFIMRL
jgi:hypothetical protein